jgi:hypothetical protein
MMPHVHRKHYKTWTPPEDALLLKFRAEGMGWGSIGVRLDRQASQCAAHYWYLRGQKVSDLGIKSLKDIDAERARRHKAEQHALELRDRRELSRLERDESALRAGVLTPIYFGDPPPGYSALDRRR